MGEILFKQHKALEAHCEETKLKAANGRKVWANPMVHERTFFGMPKKLHQKVP